MLVRVCIYLLNPSFLSINLSRGVKINKSKILAGPILSVFGLSVIGLFPEDEVVWLFLREYSGMIFSPPVISRSWLGLRLLNVSTTGSGSISRLPGLTRS